MKVGPDAGFTPGKTDYLALCTDVWKNEFKWHADVEAEILTVKAISRGNDLRTGGNDDISLIMRFEQRKHTKTIIRDD